MAKKWCSSDSIRIYLVPGTRDFHGFVLLLKEQNMRLRSLGGPVQLKLVDCVPFVLRVVSSSSRLGVELT